MSHAELERAALPIAEQLDLLRSMIEIRGFEDGCHRLFAQGLIRGSTHLGQGQEAVSVGACAALRAGDSMTCTYRGHAATLAMGAPLDRCFAEIIGRAGGVCGGKGGSLHMTDVACGAMGSFAIVGAHLPISVGIALAARLRRTDAVSLCFFGDGSTNIGAFHEALNLAAVWKLPVVFVCENNLYGEYSPLARTTPIQRLADRADSYGMDKAQLDGNRVVEIHAGVSEAVARARAGKGATLVEALTYRQKGHSRSDPAAYRPEGELEHWLKRDPIMLHEQELLAAGVGQEQIDLARTKADENVAESIERALSWPEPSPDRLLEHVYSA
jgi:acetoin:2,6-dichlorophenolindophenol oxidoreductase subunit alpha